jgi:hypothetical protein
MQGMKTIMCGVYRVLWHPPVSHVYWSHFNQLSDFRCRSLLASDHIEVMLLQAHLQTVELFEGLDLLNLIHFRHLHEHYLLIFIPFLVQSSLKQEKALLERSYILAGLDHIIRNFKKLEC